LKLLAGRGLLLGVNVKIVRAGRVSVGDQLVFLAADDVDGLVGGQAAADGLAAATTEAAGAASPGADADTDAAADGLGRTGLRGRVR
jgi:hypothetical protein